MENNENNRKIIFMVGLLGISLLTGCFQKNPLLTPETIKTMRSKYFFDDTSFPIEQCAKFYSGNHANLSIKSKCDQWSAEYYHSLHALKEIPVETTLDDLRDPEFWKKVDAE